MLPTSGRIVSILTFALDFQRLLVEVGAIKENDMRVLHRESSEEGLTARNLRQGNINSNDDDDWD